MNEKPCPIHGWSECPDPCPPEKVDDTSATAGFAMRATSSSPPTSEFAEADVVEAARKVVDLLYEGQGAIGKRNPLLVIAYREAVLEEMAARFRRGAPPWIRPSTVDFAIRRWHAALDRGFERGAAEAANG